MHHEAFFSNTKPRILAYPFPINGSAAKFRVARKSSWVEVTAPLSPAGIKGGYALSPFPITIEQSDPICWTTPRVNIDQQPVLQLDQDLEWIATHLSQTPTSQQQATWVAHPRGSPTRPKDGLLDMKQTLILIFSAFAGLNQVLQLQRFKWFRLQVVSTNVEDMLLRSCLGNVA